MRFACFDSLTFCITKGFSVKTILKFIGFFMMLILSMSFAEASSYTIKAGDTLSAIARSHKTTISALLELNTQITNPDKIYAGKTITVERETESVAVSQPQDIPRVTALPKPSQSVRPVQQAKAPDTICNTTAAIERFGFPKEVAEEFITAVSNDASLSKETNVRTEHVFAVEHINGRYTFSYTDNCLFAKSEILSSPLVAKVKEETETGPPSPTAKPYMSEAYASYLRNIGQEATAPNPRESMKKLLLEAIGPPYDVEIILAEMDRDAQAKAWGLNMN